MSVSMDHRSRPDAGDPNPQQWQGFAEIDHAIRENRLTEYRLRKSWADPWERKLTIAVLSIISLGFVFLCGALAGLW